MNIGDASQSSGVSAKMIRYYESIGLIPAASRSAAGYRIFDETKIRTLRFIRRARDFGLPIVRIKLLVSLWQGHKPSRGVKKVVLEHVEDLTKKIVELTAMRDALKELADACEGDNRPECPILRDLES